MYYACKRYNLKYQYSYCLNLEIKIPLDPYFLITSIVGISSQISIRICKCFARQMNERMLSLNTLMKHKYPFQKSVHLVEFPVKKRKYRQLVPPLFLIVYEIHIPQNVFTVPTLKFLWHPFGVNVRR